jgi:hypothetical protein
VDDDRRFLYALSGGCAVSGLLFWLTFWHGRVLLGIAWGLTATALVLGRYGAPRYWERLRRHGTPREIAQFKITLLVLTLIVVVTSVVLTLEGVLK